MAVAHLQNANNLPQMTSSAYASSLYNGTGTATPTLPGLFMGLGAVRTQQDDAKLDAMIAMKIHDLQQGQKPKKEEKMSGRRLVKVIIVDPDEKVPLEKCILYSGDEKLTDLTDQELFFEIEINTILTDHNKVRTGIVDKTVKERTEHLEEIKVRDLRMVVVTVAQF